MSQSLYCAGGKLIRQDQAPRCADCGVRLWTPVSKPYAPATHDEKGRRLGIAKTVRYGEGRAVYCWNGKACAARQVASASPAPGAGEGGPR